MRRAVLVLVAALLVGGAVALALGRGARRSPPTPDLFVTLRSEPVARPEPPPGARDLVLVVGCTVRADQTTPYGGPPSTTPFLAELATSGARLADLVAAAPWTRPASTALLTGRHALSVGMADPAAEHDELRLPEEVVTLAEHLRSRGWRTIGLTTNPNLNDTFGFRQGFDAWRQLPRLWREEGTKVPGVWAVRDALALLDAEREEDRPTFLLVVLVDAHAPHDATPAELRAHLDGGLPGQVVAYRAVLRRFDDAVRELATGLAERGLGPREAVLAVVNDHGDGLGWPAHHGRSHGRFLVPSAVGGVFVVRGPGVAPGTVVEGVASQIDVAPTLASLVGAPGMPGEGRDLSEVVRHGGRTGEDVVYTDTWFHEVDRAAAFTEERACQRSFSGDPDPLFADGCFDRRADPSHAEPLPPDATMERLVRWRAEQAGAPRIPAEPDAEVVEQLRALGYVP